MGARLFRISLWLLSLLPLGGMHAVGRLIGAGLFRSSGKIRQTTARNVSACFPDLSPAAQETLLRETLAQTGAGFAELGMCWHWPWHRVQPLIREIEGEDLLREALDGGQGVLLALPHLGCWEIVGLYCGHHYGMTSLYRRPRLAGLDSWMRQVRQRTGGHLLPAGTVGVRGILKALKNNQLCCILPDQEPKSGEGVFAPFFGHQALTMVLFGKLARRSGARVLYAWAERLPDAGGYRLHFQAADAAVADPDPATAATALNAGIEACVRPIPAQYQWTYRRFRARPPGEDRFYPRK